jgi:hypothetical protein
MGRGFGTLRFKSVFLKSVELACGKGFSDDTLRTMNSAERKAENSQSKGVAGAAMPADADTACRTGRGQVIENVGRCLSRADTKSRRFVANRKNTGTP